MQRVGSKSLVVRQGRGLCYSGGNRKAAVAVLMLAGTAHGQGHGEIMGWMKLAVLSTPWPLPSTHSPDPLPLVHELATCPVDTEATEDKGKKEAIDKNTERKYRQFSFKINVLTAGSQHFDTTLNTPE